MKLVIFDIDGTLTNTNSVYEKCFLDAFGEYLGTDLKNQHWHGFTHITESSITEEIFEQVMKRKPSEEERDTLKRSFVKKLKEELLKDRSQFREVSGAVNFFNHLYRSDEFHVGIATGSWSHSAKVKLNAIALNYRDIPFSHCDYFISREEITRDAINKSRKQYGTTFDEIIYFGDGIWDYNTCKNLNIRFIGIDCSQNGKLYEIGAKHVFPDYIEADQIVAVLQDGF